LLEYPLWGPSDKEIAIFNQKIFFFPAANFFLSGSSKLNLDPDLHPEDIKCWIRIRIHIEINVDPKH
jgi:hypothetical protein